MLGSISDLKDSGFERFFFSFNLNCGKIHTITRTYKLTEAVNTLLAHL